MAINNSSPWIKMIYSKLFLFVAIIGEGGNAR